MSTLDKLVADFGAFQTDFSAFVINVQAALDKLAAGGLTPAQQAQVDSIDAAVTNMDTQVQGIKF